MQNFIKFLDHDQTDNSTDSDSSDDIFAINSGDLGHAGSNSEDVTNRMTDNGTYHENLICLPNETFPVLFGIPWPRFVFQGFELFDPWMVQIVHQGPK